jgi:hypothetical protein
MSVPLFSLERDQLAARRVVGEEDLGAGVGIQRRLEGELELPRDEVVVVGVVRVAEREEVCVDADLGVQRLQGSLATHELTLLGLGVVRRNVCRGLFGSLEERFQLVALLFLGALRLEPPERGTEAVDLHPQRVHFASDRVSHVLGRDRTRPTRYRGGDGENGDRHGQPMKRLRFVVHLEPGYLQ